MGQIAQDLIRIQVAKSALRDAILAKGGTLSEDARIDEYAPAVLNIQDHPMDTVIVKTPRIRQYDVTYNISEYVPFWNPRVLVLDLPNCISASRAIQNGTNLISIDVNLPKCVNAEHLIHGCSSLREFGIYLPEATNLDQFAIDCTSLVSLVVNAPKCTMGRWLVQRCPNLETLEANLPECTNLYEAMNASPKLSAVKIAGLKTSLNLSLCPLLSLESVQYIVEHAQEAMEGAVLTLPRALESKLPEETMEMALEKGFNVAFR